MNARTLITASLMALAIFALCACVANGSGWLDGKQVDALPAVFVSATASEIQAKCPKVRTPYGCAVRDWSARICRIYVEPNPPVWLYGHELAHCAGWNHPI